MKKPDNFDGSDLFFGFVMFVVLGIIAAFASVIIWAIFKLVNHWTATPALVGFFS